MESILRLLSDPFNIVSLSRNDIIRLLSINQKSKLEHLRQAAMQMLHEYYGTTVHLRGLIEFSNGCINDCHYCGIRLGNNLVKRFVLTSQQITEAALFAAQKGYGSIVLQSGERRDEPFIDMVESVIKTIKTLSQSESLPNGLAITLSIGEQSPQTYERWYKAGAHRYLLRIETSSPDLFRRIHPVEQRIETRLHCLATLKELGFIVGTGVMIGLPGQTIANLADDILFFKSMGADMIGMGPYLPHKNAVLTANYAEPSYTPQEAFALTLKMIAVTRLYLRNVNIAATTALQTIAPDGREQGLCHGANIIMPSLTPQAVRRDYLLYDNKPCVDESAEQCAGCLTKRIEGIGRKIGWNQWGDPLSHTRKAKQLPL